MLVARNVKVGANNGVRFDRRRDRDGYGDQKVSASPGINQYSPKVRRDRAGATGQDNRSDIEPRRDRAEVSDQKISARFFALLAETSADRVTRYLAAWNRAAEAGHVPHSDDLAPGRRHISHR